jgi:hypothetical protein
MSLEGLTKDDLKRLFKSPATYKGIGSFAVDDVDSSEQDRESVELVNYCLRRAKESR